MVARPRVRARSPSSTAAAAAAAPDTPQRRSIYDLQLLIDELFEDKQLTSYGNGDANDGGDGSSNSSSKTCRSADLPGILAAFEDRRGIVLLSEDEKIQLASFAQSVGSSGQL